MKRRNPSNFLSRNWGDIVFGVLIMLPLFILLWLVVIQPFDLSSVGGPTKYVPENENLVRINSLRKEPLQEKQSLAKSAQIKADDLASGGDWSHDSPNAKFSAVIFEHNPNAVEVGENLAKCFANEDDALEAWKQSPSHYDNIKGDWQYWGRGVATGNGCTYIVDHFSREVR